MKYAPVLLLPLAFGFAGYFAVAESENAPVAVLSALSEPPAQEDVKPLELLFTGDVMLDRGVALHAQAYGDDSLLAGVQSAFAGMDLVIANLEGTITNNPSVSILNHTNLRFTFNPRFAPFLKRAGIGAVSLSNNHADDFGTNGYAQTKANLAMAGIYSFGSPANDRDLSTEIRVRNQTVCLVGYEGFINSDPASVAVEIRRIRPECGFLVATMHAGEEYQQTVTQLQTDAAHAFIDAGADVVIGTHPHVVEPLEIYKDKPIFYSLGNFLFDQDFSWATTHGLAVRITANQGETSYALIPITVRGNEAAVTKDSDDIQRTLGTLLSPNLQTGIASAILDKHQFTLK